MAKLKKNKKKRFQTKTGHRVVKPAEQQAALNLALDQFNNQNYKAAEKILADILRHTPDHGLALSLNGVCQQEQGNIESAIASLQKAAKILPNDPDIQFNLGVIFQNKGQNDEAMTYYEKALRLQPTNHKALNNTGTLLHTMGDTEKAITKFKSILAIDPTVGSAHLNLGEMYREIGAFRQAIEHYKKGLQLSPDSPNSYNNLATIHKDFGQLSEAMDCYNKALKLDNSQHWLYSNIGVILISQGKTEEASEWFHKALSIKSDFDDSTQNYLMSLNYTDTLTPAEIFKKHKAWGKDVEARMAHKLHTHHSPINNNQKIRIGYVSADFWQHAVGNFIEPALAVHNHNDFEITCYSDVTLADIATEGLKSLADKWHDIHELNDDEVAELITSDGIDILVDLGGHMGKSRLTTFAQKPAPIQVTYLGYPNTTGLSTMDYRITDNIADPKGKTEHLNSETLIRLPNCFLCYAPPPEELPINDPPFLKNGYITFASFNNRPKITDKVITCW
ncbi:MAG: tetratricopeptide repeat protein, partial [Desulfobulbaceae bacterium]|nr:tetratricopeptide repeat protein [Desulfobulbaceae bacterium]